MKKDFNHGKKILMITLDGGTLDLIKPLVELGYMPTIKRLLETGSFGILNSTIPPVSAPAWASFMTGKNPGKHGVFSFRTYEPGTNRDYFVNSQSIKGKTIWNILSEKGKKVIVINLPMTYPPYPVNGIMISGFDTPSIESPFTYPEELKKEILSLYPNFDLIPDVSAMHDFNQFMTQNSSIMKNLAEVALHHMENTPWDVFMINFQNTDWIQHLFWEYLIKELKQESLKEQTLRLLGLYNQLDSYIASLINMAGEETVKILFSDHGFGPYIGDIYINQLLMDWGLLSLSGTGLEKLEKILRKFPCRIVERGFNVLKRLKIINNSSHVTHRTTVERLRKTELHNVLPIRWSKTRACTTIMKGICGFIYINLKGRQPHGIVNPGEEYENLRNQIIDNLKTTRDQIDGDPLFQSIYKPEDVYPGYDSKISPDIIVVPKFGYSVSLMLSSDMNKYTRVYDDKQWGDHRMEGFIIAHDPEVFKGGIPISANITDIAPTVLNLLGLPIPNDMDGRVLTELLNHPEATTHEESHQSLFKKNDRVHSREESIEIKKRLRELGYID